jgi:hypothetical protein
VTGEERDMKHRIGGWIAALIATAGLVVPADSSAQQRESVAFDGRTLVLAWEGENRGERIREYIPEGEQLDSWTTLASIREYPNLNDPKAVVANLLRVLKQNTPKAPSAVQENARTGEVVVDFVTWPPDESFVEFNVWKYRRAETGGLVAHQYALRDYRDPKGFLRGLKPVRERLVRLMVEGGLERHGGHTGS